MAILEWHETRRYMITEDGEIYDTLRRKKKPTFLRNGYKCVRINDGNRDVNEYVHRLIAMTNIPNPNNLPCVNHKNGNKLDNNVDNLEWCDKATNNFHAYREGLRKNGRGGGKNTPVRCIEDGIIFPSIQQASEYYNIKHSAIQECISGRNKTCNGKHWERIEK